MSVGHNAKTAAEAGLQPWLHGGSELEGGCGGGEAACARLSIRKSSIGPRAGLQKGAQNVCDIFPRHLLAVPPRGALSDLPRRSMLPVTFTFSCPLGKTHTHRPRGGTTREAQGMLPVPQGVSQSVSFTVPPRAHPSSRNYALARGGDVSARAHSHAPKRLSVGECK